MPLGNDEGKSRSKRGFALMFVMAFAAIVVVFTASIGAQATYNLRLAGNRGEIDRAYYSAQTGTQLILSLLREPPEEVDYNGDGVPGPWLAEDASLHLEIPATNAEAKAHVYHNFQGFPNPQPVAPDGTKIPEDHFYIISVGVVNGVYDADGNLKSGIEYEANTMGSTLNPSYPLTPQAIFGYDEIDVDGQVAHFDSSTSGPWAVDDGGTGTGDHMACPFPEGTVGIATKDDTKMIIRENAKIDGHIIFGVGTPNSEKIDEQTAIASFPGGASPPIATTPLFAYGRSRQISGTPNQPNVNGEIGELVTDPPVVDMNFQPSDYYQTLPSGGMGSITLQEGKIYEKNGDLRIVGSDTITVNDTNGDGEIEDTIMVVHGNISFLNCTIGVNGKTPPRQLKIYSDDAGAQFNMQDSTAFCLVAGKDMVADINTGSTLWGAVLARKVVLDQTSAVNYDVTLRDPTLIADIYGYYLVGSSIVSGASVPTGTLGPTGTTAPAAPAPAPAPATAPATAPAPAPAPAPATSGCGCGCGCGSMLVMRKL